MAWVAVAGLGISAGAKVFSAIKAGKAAKANQKILDGQIAEAKTDANKSFLDTSAAKDAVKVANENLVDERKNVAGRGAITGASDEAIVASQSNVSKNHNATISRLAGMGTEYQERAKSRLNNLAGMQMGVNQAKADSAANLSDAAGDLASTAAMGIGGIKSKVGSAKAGKALAGDMVKNNANAKWSDDIPNP